MLSTLIALCSFVISVIALTNGNTRDKKKVAIEVVERFDKLVLPLIKKADEDQHLDDYIEDSILAIIYIVQLYSNVHSGLANEKLVKSYLNFYLKMANSILNAAAISLSSEKQFKFVIKKYDIIITQLLK